MARRVSLHEQQSLFPTPALAGLPGYGPAKVRFDEILEAFIVKAVMRPNNKTPCLIDQLFAHCELRESKPLEMGDAMTTHLMAFAPDDLPRFTSNTCKPLGDLFEWLIRTIYEAAHPVDYTQDYAALEKKVLELQKKLVEKGKILNPGKFEPEFLIGLLAYEIKYRTGNGQGSTEQRQGAKTLIACGFEPRMLLYRPSPNAAKYSRGGWTCTEGAATVARIEAETGINVDKLIAQAGLDPRVIQRRELGRSLLMARENQAAAYKKKTYGKEMAAARAR